MDTEGDVQYDFFENKSNNPGVPSKLIEKKHDRYDSRNSCTLIENKHERFDSRNSVDLISPRSPIRGDGGYYSDVELLSGSTMFNGLKMFYPLLDMLNDVVGKTGRTDMNSFRSIVNDMEMDLTQSETKQAFEEFDLDNDGVIMSMDFFFRSS